MAVLSFLFKKNLFEGISYLERESKSQCRLWLKLDKFFFGLEKDLPVYLCAVYILPYNPVHSDADYILNLENEIAKLSMKGDIALIGDFNTRTSTIADFVLNDSDDTDLIQEMLPPNYDDDLFIQRYNQDKIINSHGTSLVNMCTSSGLRILNGRYIGDSLGYHNILQQME